MRKLAIATVTAILVPAATITSAQDSGLTPENAVSQISQAAADRDLSKIQSFCRGNSEELALFFCNISEQDSEVVDLVLQSYANLATSGERQIAENQARIPVVASIGNEQGEEAMLVLANEGGSWYLFDIVPTESNDNISNIEEQSEAESNNSSDGESLDDTPTNVTPSESTTE
ncbi:hypothetical protein IQ241_04230 [Romeria aff. gracilis LEGE 07310]|uniref:DUF4878 domain-containing protein n=1 Tax=Vasconcelosia minhoensis LEGE 07310 TaxID=915328 RepID=A0A8J7AKT6_9CYAN|nr:hypothetical protein [Romeria gracilis]MBE9076509.1 hypothetical protein [Romeria aff. gracilis LEGE 07310]